MLVVVVVTACVASRRNIVRMIKGQADSPRWPVAPRRRLFGGVLVAVGVATLIAGLVASNGVASVLGPALGGIGLVMLVAAPGRTRLVGSLTAAGVFIWSALVPTVVSGSFTGLSVALIATEGVVMSAAAVALVSLNHATVTRRWSAPRGRRGVPLGIGLAYSRSAPSRTALIVSMYAVAIFTLTLLVTIGQFYSHSVDAVARRLGGAAALEVTSDATRPVPARDVTEMPGVTRVTAASTIDAQLQDGPSSAPVPVSIVGFDRSFVAHGAPAVAHGSGDSLFASVARDPTKVIVGTDLRSDLQSGLPGRPVRASATRSRCATRSPARPAH